MERQILKSEKIKEKKHGWRSKKEGGRKVPGIGKGVGRGWERRAPFNTKEGGKNG